VIDMLVNSDGEDCADKGSETTQRRPIC